MYTIVNVLKSPLSSIGQTLPGLFASFASLGRIQGFLQLPEKAESEQYSLQIPELVDVSVGEDTAKVSVPSADVSLDGCTFSWDDKTKAPVLQDITLELAPRALHMIVGSVASVSFHYAGHYFRGADNMPTGQVEPPYVAIGRNGAGGRHSACHGAEGAFLSQ